MSTLNLHDFTVGEILTAATMDGQTADLSTLNSDKAEIKTGEYTGDGSTAQTITGLGFTPAFGKVWYRVAHGNVSNVYETTTEIIAHNAEGLALRPSDATMYYDTITAFGSGSFTVDDHGADSHPNKNGVVYCYLMIGKS